MDVFYANRMNVRTAWRLVLPALLLFLILTASPAAGIASPILTLRFIDVGEGDAVFLDCPGHGNILVDTGNLKTGVRVLSALLQAGVSRIDHLILTHPHLDHVGGVFTVAQLLPVGRFYDNGEDLSALTKTDDPYRWYRDLVRISPRYTPLKSGQIIACPPLTVRVLWPPRPGVTRDWNTNSLVLMVSFGAFRCLLMGDANIETERRLLKRRASLRAPLLKIGHHGARETATRSFLAAVSPEAVIISVDRGNTRGYPAKETLRRIRCFRTRLYRTDRNGTITVRARFDGTFRITPERP